MCHFGIRHILEPRKINSRLCLVKGRSIELGDFMTIRNTLIAAGSALALAALATGASAAGTVSATANASVTVVAPTSITKTSDMVFGTVVRPSAGTTTITLSDLGVVTALGGDGSVVASTTSAAKFVIASAAAVDYTLSQDLTFTQPGLLNIVLGNVATTSGTPGHVNANGSQEIRYGAKFDITPTTPAQTYTGALSVTATYN